MSVPGVSKMGFSWLRKFTFSKTAYANTPGQFLKLSKTCKEQVLKMTTPSVLSTSPKVNSELCKYLADKLKLAVESAHSFLLNRGLHLLEETGGFLDVFRLLHALATVVENFIRSCCQDAWIEGAVLMPNVSEHVLPVCFDLELLRHLFCGSLTLTDFDGVYNREAAIVREKGSHDREALLREANALLQTKKKTCKEYQLATLLLEKLGTPRQNLVAGSVSGVYDTDMESLKQMEQLGKGSFGIVYKAMWLGVEVAKKTIYAPRCPDFEKEVSILGQLSHPNIASLLCYGGHERECCMVMELMDGDLFSMMQKIMAEDKTLSYPFSILEAVDIILQVGRGMEYLHEMRIVHRDLKSMNILVRRVKGREFEGGMKYILAKLNDFGLSKTKERSMTYGTQTPNVGTPQWMAPEVIKFRENKVQIQVSNDPRIAKYPFSADVYSFGMVCYEILTGRRPFFEIRSPSEVKMRVLKGERPELPSYCPPMLEHLIVRCWSEDPMTRPRFGEVCAELRHLKCQLLMPYAQEIFERCLPSSSASIDGSRVHEAESPGSQSDVSEPSSSTLRYDPDASYSDLDFGVEEESDAMVEDPSGAKIVVGLDFGTTFSGYAFAHKSKPKEILTFYDWPRSMNSNCKTFTALYYEPGDAGTAQVKSWGFPALYDFTKDIDNIQELRAKSVADLPEIGTYLVRFKLHLANKDVRESSATKLPKGFTVTQVVADFLQGIGASIMRHLRSTFSDDITVGDVQWCVTVPSIWDDHAKKQMEVCMVRAGLIRGANSSGGSPHPLSIVLEPEAASCYCHRNMPDLELRVGDRLLVADIGGGTTDIVVQEWISETPDDYRVKEVLYSTGGLCGGTYVDEQFNKFLFAKIECLPQFVKKSSAFMAEIFKGWEEIKCSFSDLVTIGESFEIQLPSKLAAEWEEWDEEHGRPTRSSYDELELTHADIKGIFDPVVEQNLALIADQLSRTSNVKVIFVVGGFAGSPYLVSKIKERFLGTVEKVISPVNPGSAVCQGAVMLALNPAGITSRIARKTYGFEVSRAFKAGDPEGTEYISWVGANKKCDVSFSACVKKGDPLAVEHCVSKDFAPLYPGDKTMKLLLYSSNDTDPQYTRGPGVDSKEEASFTIDISASSHMEARPTVNVTMYFGRSAIEVKAVGNNFGNGEVQGFLLPVEFRGDWV